MAAILRPGDQIIPGYRLVRFLGRGGFGQVWESSAPGGTRTALKLIDLRGNPECLREFRGIQRVKDIRYAHLVQITALWLLDDNGEVLDDDAIAALEMAQSHGPRSRTIVPEATTATEPAMLVVAMQLCDRSLLSRLEECLDETRDGIPVDELLHYMEQAAHGIDFLNRPIHNLGGNPVSVQHCDIKPDNLLLAGDSVQICDFGIAKVFFSRKDLSGTFCSYSTPYAAPELIRQDGPTSSTDQYSLACTYYHLRTGRYPFSDDVLELPTDVCRAQMSQIHVSGQLDLSAIADERERAIVRRATSLDPSHRFDSCTDMVRALRAALVGEAPPSGQTRTRRRVIGGRRVALVAACLLVISSIGFYAIRFRSGFWSGAPAPDRPSVEKVAVDFSSLDRKKLADAHFQAEKYNDAFTSILSIAREYPALREQVDHWQSTRLAELLVRADQLLATSSPEIAAAQKLFQTVLDHSAPGENPVSMWTSAAQGSARCDAMLAISGQRPWGALRQQLDLIRQQHLAVTEQASWQAFDILARSENQAQRLFDAELLAAVIGYRERHGAVVESSWEASQIERLIIEGFGLLESKTIALADSDPRTAAIEKLFAARYAEWKSLATLERALVDRTSPLSTVEAASLDASIQQLLGGNPTEPTRRRARFMQALLRVQSPAALADDAFRLEPLELTPSELHLVLSTLQQRLAHEVLHRPLSPAILAQCTSLVELAQKRLAADRADPLDRTLRLIRVVNVLHDASLDAQQIANDCQPLLGDLNLTVPLESLAALVWAECTLLSRATATATPLDAETRQLLEAVYRHPAVDVGSRFAAYREFVRGRMCLQRLGGEPARVADHFQFLMTADELPAFIWQSDRRQLAATWLLDQAAALRSGDDRQIEKDAYDQAAAATAYECLKRIGQKLKSDAVPANRQEEYLRLCLLTGYYSRNLALANLLQSASLPRGQPERPQDGQVLLTRAKAAYDLATASRNAEDFPPAIHAAAQVLAWNESRPDSAARYSWTVYDRVIQPVFDRARQLQWEDAQGDAALERLHALPDRVQADLAFLYAQRARWIEVDPFTAQKLELSTRAVRWRSGYRDWRTATELDPTNADYLVRRYLALARLTDQDPEDRWQEQSGLASRAVALDEVNPATRLIHGHVLIARARREPSLLKRREYLQQGLSELNVDVTKLPPDLLASFLVLRSSAKVEAGNVEPDAHVQLQLFKEGKEDGEQAILYQHALESPEYAYIAAAHAAEDIAYFATRRLQMPYGEHFQQATRYLETALADTTRPWKNDPAIRYALGRTLYRWVERDCESPGRPDADMRSRLEQATQHLQLVAQQTGDRDLQVEAGLLLWTCHHLMAKRMRTSGAERTAQEAQAEKCFATALELANAAQWLEAQQSHAQYDLQAGRLNDAGARARAVLDRVMQRSEPGLNTLSWDQIAWLLSAMYAGTSPDRARADVIQYRQRLERGQPAETRCQLLLAVPRLLVVNKLVKDVATCTMWEPDVQSALSLAETYKLAEIERDARWLLGSMALTRFVLTPGDPQNSRFTHATTAAAHFTRSVEIVEAQELANVDTSTASFKNELYSSYAAAAGLDPETAKDAVQRDRVIQRLTAFLQRPGVDRGVKDTIAKGLEHLRDASN